MPEHETARRAKMTRRDKYGFKRLEVGKSRMILGPTAKHAQMTYYRYCERYPEMIDRDFEWKQIKGGVVVTRTR